MSSASTHSLDSTFAALADPTRRAMLARLSHGTATVGELAEPFGISLPAVSKHLRVLEDAGLVAREKRGRAHHCQLNVTPLKDAEAWIEHQRQFWESRLDALADYLAESARAEHSGDARSASKKVARHGAARSSARSAAGVRAPRRGKSRRSGR